MAYGPGGIVAAGYDRLDGGGVVLFNASGERLRPAPLEVKEGGVTSVTFGPGGTLAAGYFRAEFGGAVNFDGGVVLFDAKGQRLRPTPLEVKEGSVTSVAFGPGGALAAGYSTGGGGGGGVVLFDAKGERLRPAPMEVKDGHVSSVAFGPEGTLAAGYFRAEVGGVLHFDGGVVLFDAKGERLRATPIEVMEGRVSSVAFGSGSMLAAGYDRADASGGLVLFDAKGKRLRTTPMEVKEGRVRTVAFGPGGALAAGYDRADASGGVVLFDAKGERLRTTPMEVKEGYVISVAFGPRGTLAVGHNRGVIAGVVHFDGGVLLFDAKGERLRTTQLQVKEGRVSSVAFGPGGTLAAGFYRIDEGGVVLFDAKGERLRPGAMVVNEGGVASVAFGPEGTFASGHNRGGAIVVLFDVNGERLRAPRLRSRRAISRTLPSARGHPRRGFLSRRRRRGAVRRQGRAAPHHANGDQRGHGKERGVRSGGHSCRGVRSRQKPRRWRHVNPGRRGRGAVRRQGRADPPRTDRAQGGPGHERGLRPGRHARRGVSIATKTAGWCTSASAGAWCCTTPRASGSAPGRWTSGRVVS